MKKVTNQILVAIALLLVGGSVFAGDSDPDISIRKSQGEKQTLVRVANLSTGTAVLRLKDAQGRVLHREAIKGDAYMKKYNMASLPAGEYTFEVRSAEGISQETFTLNEGTAQAIYFKPAVQIDEEMVKVMFKNSIASPVSLKLYDRYGEVLYQETVACQEQYAKGLNLSKLAAGQYSLSLTGDNYVYSKSIALK
ncbi:MAG: hypothetical protein WA960_21900 [Tunicatimonas sp.]